MIDNTFIPYRLETETQQDYRLRQKTKQIELKAMKRGSIVWDSYKQGQYIKGVK